MKSQKSEKKIHDTRYTMQDLSKGHRVSCIMHHASELRNEKGIALVMVLMLSAIILAIMAGLIYMVTSGTQVSGIQKRYKTALESGVGGANITFQFIKLKEDTSGTASLLTDLVSLTPTITTPAGCTSTDILSRTFTGLYAKLNAPTSAWSNNCDSSLTITPSVNSTYDMSFDLGTNPTYRVYSKIVDTVYGNTGGDEGMIKGQVVGQNDEQGVTVPFFYTIELDAENTSQPVGNRERAKLSILYKE